MRKNRNVLKIDENRRESMMKRRIQHDDFIKNLTGQTTVDEDDRKQR